ncbi:DUF1963 domain-containing protein [Kitasatospora sp. NPDC049285]|uniref:DUF1963 domain-containing protein n=1 Tax=Kitasatospora sp. NPDC049285 TaxID=3157096 RepID=UPI00342AA636
MVRTTPPRPVDVEELFPELAAYRVNAVRLHPRRGEPGERESSVGGPVVWPRGEAWPRCEEEHPGAGYAPPEGAGAIPLVPVVQLFAADAPELPFPAGTDVVQVLWCPFDHEEDYAPRPAVYWWDGSRPDLAPADPPRPDGAPEDYLPDRCVLHPEPVAEYPSWDLPAELHGRLRERFDRLEEETGWSYQRHLSVPDGIKAGGYPTWTQEPDWPDCPGCERRMEHLLSIGSAEFDGGSWRAWLPIEDTPATGTVWDLPYERRTLVQGAPGLMLGDMGGVYLFTCPRCPDRPFAHRFDCS